MAETVKAEVEPSTPFDWLLRALVIPPSEANTPLVEEELPGGEAPDLCQDVG